MVDLKAKLSIFTEEVDLIDVGIADFENFQAYLKIGKICKSYTEEAEETYRNLKNEGDILFLANTFLPLILTEVGPVGDYYVYTPKEGNDREQIEIKFQYGKLHSIDIKGFEGTWNYDTYEMEDLKKVFEFTLLVEKPFTPSKT